MFEPQQRTTCAALTAQPWALPHATPVAANELGNTSMGGATLAPTVPQHHTAPSVVRTHVCAPPAAIAVAAGTPAMLTGVLDVGAPPSSPYVPSPQHHALLSPLSTQVWTKPRAMFRAS